MRINQTLDKLDALGLFGTGDTPADRVSKGQAEPPDDV